jgi:hypothetical protein
MALSLIANVSILNVWFYFTFIVLGLPNFIDRSPDPKRPGRICVMEAPVCQDPNKNDCHPSATCLPLNGTKFDCKCRDGFLDKSPSKSRPGRLCIELVSINFFLFKLLV